MTGNTPQSSHCSYNVAFQKTFKQNYGDKISESLQLPTLPDDFAELSEIQRLQQAELLRKRQLHNFYVKKTETMNPDHYHALIHDFSALRRQLFQHTRDPWEGDNITLKAGFVALSRAWEKINPGTKEACPVSFTNEESTKYLQMEHAQLEADEQFQQCKEAIGVGSEGRVPNEYYEDAKECERKLKADALDAAETDEERQHLIDNWLFDDFSEEEYM